ncbi:MAG: 1-deoxy-D-xylulose-5-phosphate synthase [Alphaproteobacteria bacterium]|uniref:1-deoxy-D-xylulose-5-phosphate synthase n=1 Tax=PS1 clade bacterium TaxID=2175152 RepID=A0A368DSH5_9PROT|nr:1-deoxy-D-xylulose-5-phosphate synthase [Rhodobiaceae bacterium]OUT73549.1 MAG: 1-deoxy-D-xylulose-5-phosphate synthase [Rhizobiales bacterium TMED25]RCL74161.1 MAG: 1-deoxy-D-xylulose-5-phosphate synthase [PS1 clade bacterium]|tara:strand:+ start:2594 stop:4483 length:1890 start_codon:yes stop_codon:yes gene_type:complete
MTATPLLDKISDPKNLRQFSESELQPLAKELREELIQLVSKTGGHLGAGLGVIELTIALHYIFDTPKDRIIWDVGHQAYPHKILTGRRKEMSSLRQGGGLSGFTKRSESIYDPFGAAHSSTSISSSLGMSVARDIQGQNHNIIAVIGDGAMSAGMAYEAMNNAGVMKNKLIVILNDNDMSIARPVGAMSAYLAKLISSGTYSGFRNYAKKIIKYLPSRIKRILVKMEGHGRSFFTGGTLFEELGFYYVGPIDGHNFNHLIPILRNVKSNHDGPILIHIVTKKGKGYSPAENSKDKYHGVSKFDVTTGEQISKKSNIPPYTKVFANQLVKEAENDKKIISITAAMPTGTGLDIFQQKFPDRYFDVGIAEQHAVTFAAGLASDGFKPFCAIYSTFLQRAYDQVIHDVGIQNLPVRFAIDRAGLVGEDGATHAGSFDIMYLSAIPNFTVMAPSNELELARMVKTAANFNEGPIAFRYPRGNGIGIDIPEDLKPIEIGKARLIEEGSDLVILSYGTIFKECEGAVEALNKDKIFPTFIDARFAKPLDTQIISKYIKSHKFILTVEEGVIGGFSAQVSAYLQSNKDYYINNIKYKNITLPDRFIDQDTQANQIGLSGLDSEMIYRAAKDLMNVG